MLGESLAVARSRKIQRELELKAAARRYDQWARQQGLSRGDAIRFAPSDVQAGWGLIRSEQKRAQRDAYHSYKERLAQRFNVNQSPRA